MLKEVVSAPSNFQLVLVAALVDSSVLLLASLPWFGFMWPSLRKRVRRAVGWLANNWLWFVRSRRAGLPASSRRDRNDPRYHAGPQARCTAASWVPPCGARANRKAATGETIADT